MYRANWSPSPAPARDTQLEVQEALGTEHNARFPTLGLAKSWPDDGVRTCKLVMLGLDHLGDVRASYPLLALYQSNNIHWHRGHRTQRLDGIEPRHIACLG